MRVLVWVAICAVALLGCEPQKPTLRAPRATPVVIRSASTAGPVPDIAPRPTNLPYDVPRLWTEADGAAVHAAAFPVLPPGLVPAGSHFWPMNRGVDGALQCPRYSVALAGADAPGTLAAIQTTLAAAYERDEYSQVGQVIEHDSFDENHGYLRVPFSVWAPDRSYGIGVGSGRVLDVMSSFPFQWFSPNGADQMIVLTYLQRCALR